ncbi:MAG: GH32 C-terminal domain-containing protein, partial [Clostridia bacterium]|nr:GH32 C-terminal domain-containing protein [Clostridia bacterium]
TPDAILGNIHDPKIWRDSDGEIRLRLNLDQFSVEASVNGGEQVIAATALTDLSAEGIFFFADGEVGTDVAKYDFADAAAYLVTTKKGAIRSMPTRSEIHKLLQ